MNHYEPMAGDHIDDACKKLVAVAPAWMIFNGVRVEAHLGDTASDIHTRWSAGMKAAAEESERKRKAHEATPEGQRELAKARKRAEEEKRATAAVLRFIEDSGVREAFAWRSGMGEISGFGGGYEAACRTMLYAGLAHLKLVRGVDLAAGGTDIAGDDKDLDRVICKAEPECSGAMFGVTFSACRFIAKNGWDKYVERMTR